MRKIQLMGIAVVAVFALSAFAASSALAAFSAAEWLEGNPGKVIAAAKVAETKGGLTLENVKEKASILCTGAFDGTVGPGSADEVTKVLTSAGVEVPELDETTATGGIKCTGVKTCETESEVWPQHLPWKSEVQTELAAKTFFDLVLKNAKGVVPGYTILCLALGGLVNVEELCEAVEGSSGQLLNLAAGVEPTGSIEPLGPCNGTAEVGLIIADAGGLATLYLSTEVLSVSE
jgi:hypothetical protein